MPTSADLPPLARAGGLFYLLTFVTGGIARTLARRLIVAGDPTGTATRLLGHLASYWGAYTAYVAAVLCYVVVVALFFGIFARVDRAAAVAAAALGAVGCSVQATICTLFLSVPLLLAHEPYLASLAIDQRQALAHLCLKIYDAGFGLAFAIFGCYCLLVGTLAYRSGFVPRAIGILMIVAGLGWLTFLAPPLARHLAPFSMIPGIVGEGALTFWLLFGRRSAPHTQDVGVIPA